MYQLITCFRQEDTESMQLPGVFSFISVILKFSHNYSKLRDLFVWCQAGIGTDS